MIKNKLEKILLKYKNNNYKHECIQASIEVLITLAENKISALLVHANIAIEDNIKGHAWVEYDNYVIDLTQPSEARIMETVDFYEQAKIKKIIKYTFPEIQKLLILNTKKSSIYVWVDWLILDE